MPKALDTVLKKYLSHCKSNLAKIAGQWPESNSQITFFATHQRSMSFQAYDKVIMPAKYVPGYESVFEKRAFCGALE